MIGPVVQQSFPSKWDLFCRVSCLQQRSLHPVSICAEFCSLQSFSVLKSTENVNLPHWQKMLICMMPHIAGPPTCKSIDFVGSMVEGERLGFTIVYNGG